MRRIVLVIAGFFLIGCVGNVQNIDFNAQAHRDIKTVGLIEPATPKELTVFYHNHVGMQFGLIGAMVAAAEFSSKQTRYNKAVEDLGFDAREYFKKSLMRELTKAGYRIVVVARPKRDKNREYLNAYPNVATDAFLDPLVLTVGYVAGSSASDYKPTVTVKVRLVKAKNEAILYEKFIATGESFSVPQKAEYLIVENAPVYAKFVDLLKEPKRSVEGLKNALDEVARFVARSLQKG